MPYAIDQNVGNANDDLIEIRQDVIEGKLAIQDEAADAENTRASFYESLIVTCTSVVVELRKAVWVYEYLALANCNEVENWNENYSSDLSKLNPAPILATQLLNNQGPPLVAALKTKGTATFVLQPDTPTTTSIAGPFIPPGSHFRVRGLRAYLLGMTGPIKSLPSGAQPAVLQPISLIITMSGVCADVQDGPVFEFTMLPLSRLF
ncbi:hypothetical protein MMYC01_206931 [Madurella mycetomatis]|uniref:Uncharacterized protein n=1 Tax=Madurella mycetomatis TaxID=100816 RepID=A0A175VYD8_9PEZI|nr:hypothetical protein MMYC01_206931 [Madurella mycetomatis]